MPQAGYGLAAAYSPLTQKVYFFGGSSGAALDDGAYELTLNADNSGSITKLAAKLPKADRGGVAVEDPITHLIYIINGQYNGNVIAFDPTSLELWRTPIELPRNDSGNLLIRPYSSVIYSRAPTARAGDRWRLLDFRRATTTCGAFRWATGRVCPSGIGTSSTRSSAISII